MKLGEADVKALNELAAFREQTWTEAIRMSIHDMLAITRATRGTFTGHGPTRSA